MLNPLDWTTCEPLVAAGTTAGAFEVGEKAPDPEEPGAAENG